MPIKDALQYLVDLGEAKLHEIGGRTYSTKGLHHMTSPQAETLHVNTLSGLTDYILSEFDKEALGNVLAHVASPFEVSLISDINQDRMREIYITAKALSPNFAFERYYDLENFNIKLQSCFAVNEDTAQLLRLVSNVKDFSGKQYGDDGISQQVTAKTGIATVEDIRVPNPVILAPYRTFIEVEQPISKFVFRMRKSGEHVECALFEADGGAWKIEAMKNIKLYLQERLEGTSIKVIS